MDCETIVQQNKDAKETLYNWKPQSLPLTRVRTAVINSAESGIINWIQALDVFFRAANLEL